MTDLKKLKKHLKKTNRHIKKSPVTKGAGDLGLEVAESTPPGEIVTAAIAENEQENSKK